MGAAENIDEKKVEVAFEPTIELKTVFIIDTKAYYYYHFEIVI